MACLNECRFFNRALNIDDLSKRPNCKNLKFKRAFQFLQLLLIQRVYGIDVISYPPVRQPSKHSRRHNEQLQQQQQQNYQVFLGGSCNPTTWRRDQAIPYFQSRSVSFYNPQVSDWSPELVEIEHRAKELAPLLFFVIDYDTRALASIVEVSYLAARGRSIIVVMNPMPDRSQAKFMQQKNSHDEQDDMHDYENACEARRTLRSLLRNLNIPFFDDVRLALECAAFILESTKRTVAHRSAFSEDNGANDSEEDVVPALPSSPGDFEDARTSSVVVIRSLSNKTSYDSPDEFIQQMRQSGIDSTPSPFHRRHSSTPDSSTGHFRATAVCARTQVSCSTTESDDDGYASLSSSNRTLSSSSLSVSSELFEATVEQQREDNHLAGSDRAPPGSPIHNIMSTFCSYIPFVSPSQAPESSVTQSLFVLFTLPFRFIKQSLLFPALPAPPPSVLSPAAKPSRPKPPSSLPLSAVSMYDLYVASGTVDDCWLETFALPTLQHVKVTHTKRQSCQENDQLDALCDMHARKQSRLLYYLINGRERLADLTTELAFLIGERKHKIIVYMQSTIDDDAEQMLSPCERRDVHRSRKYLEDLTRKENVILCHSREQSWEHVLAFFSA